MSKQERYYSGMPLQTDPRKPLPGEVPPGMKERFIKLGILIGVFGFGVIMGVWASPAEDPESAKKRIAELESSIREKNERIAELSRSLNYEQTSKTPHGGELKRADRVRHQTIGKKYAAQLRAKRAQPAADLMEWFIGRWNTVLDHPMPDDRVGRRAEVLSLLVGGMAKNLHPNDFVPWQAEFLNGNWLGEVHFDQDGDGVPGRRSRKNTHDSFADTSVCHVAMALNQALTDAQVLVMPEMRCDSPKAKISVFLSGNTYNDALNELVRSLREEGFIVVEKKQKKVRLILVGPGRRG